MNSFINRQVENPNGRRIEVKEVTRDNNGEIVSMDVDMYKDEGNVLVTGTPLNAESLNEIIKGMIKEEKEELINNLLSNEDIVNIDARNTTMPSTISENITLDTKGYFKSNFTWQGDSDGVVRVRNNTLYVLKSKQDRNITLTQTIKYKDATKTKVHNIKVLKSNYEITESKNGKIILSNQDTVTFKTDIIKNSNIEVLNQYSDFLEVNTNKESDNTLTISARCINVIPSASVFDLMFNVLIKDENNKTYKKVNITVLVYSSVSPID